MTNTRYRAATGPSAPWCLPYPVSHVLQTLSCFWAKRLIFSCHLFSDAREPDYINSNDGKKERLAALEEENKKQPPRPSQFAKDPQMKSKSLDEAYKRPKSPPPVRAKPSMLGKMPKSRSESSATELPATYNKNSGMVERIHDDSRPMTLPKPSRSESIPGTAGHSRENEKRREVAVPPPIQKPGIFQPPKNKELIEQLKARHKPPVTPPSNPPRTFADVQMSNATQKSQGPATSPKPQVSAKSNELGGVNRDENNNTSKKSPPVPRKKPTRL